MNKENIIIIGNPIAGGNALKKIRLALDIFKKKGFRVELLLTEKRGDAEGFARKIARQPSTLVVAAGGDGTYNEVANGLVKSGTPMAILPVGTTSVLAKELKIPSRIPAAVDFIINGIEQAVHPGKLTLTDGSHPLPYERYFLLMAGIGFDGEAVFGVNKNIKKHLGKGGYILSGLDVFRKYNPQPITLNAYDAEVIKKCGSKDIHSNHQQHSYLSLSGYIAIIGKAACYGGDFKITRHARLTDPFFYVFIAHGRSRCSLLKYIAGIAVQVHLRYKDISYLKTAKLDVLGDSKVQIDGDYAGTTPVSVEVVPDALKLIVKNH